MKKILLVSVGIGVLCSLLIITGGLLAESLPDKDRINASKIAAAAEYPGTLKIETVGIDSVSYPPRTAVWCIRVYSDDNTFPELEISLTKDELWSSRVQETKKIIENNKAQEYKWAEAKKMNPEYFPDFGRIITLLKNREGVITALSGMAGTGIEAIIPDLEDKYFVIVRTKYGIERTTKNPKTEEFYNLLSGKTMDVIEAVAKSIDKALFK